MKTIYVVPFVHSGEEIFYDLSSHQDERIRPFIAFRDEVEKSGYAFQVTKTCAHLENPEAILSLGTISSPILENIASYPKERCSLLVAEPPTLQPWLYHPDLKNYFGKILVLFDDLSSSEGYQKFYHQQGREKKVESVPSFEEKKYCILIQSNLYCSHSQELYSKRREAAYYFSDKIGFDLFGSGWEEIPSWKGKYFGDKLDLLKNYKFHLCYENMHEQRGYITERIFESFFSGTVPVYWGASNIDQYIPADCFIDRRCFSSNEELHYFLSQMNSSTYQSYLRAADQFLASPSMYPFTPTGFAKHLLKQILPQKEG